jgi:hypothetical protein
MVLIIIRDEPGSKETINSKSKLLNIWLKLFRNGGKYER